MKMHRSCPSQRPGRLSIRIAVGLLIIPVILAFFLPLGFSQDKPTQSIQDLYKNPKIKFPEAVFQPLMDGKSTIRVIVNLKDPEVTDYQVGRNLKDMKVREELKEAVKATQESVINILDSKEIRITNRYALVFAFSGEVTLKGLEALLNNPYVLSVEEDRIVHAYLNQGIPLMNAATPRTTYNGSGMAIAICDTGIDYTHPRLGNGTFPNTKVIGGYDTGQDDSDPMDGNGHGTACAGIAAGNLGSTGDYIGGVAYNAKLYALKMTYTATNGSAYTSDMVEAWDWCVAHQNDDPSNPIMIISTSFGGGRFYDQYNCDSASAAMTTAAANAVSVGMTIFAATGNDGYCDSTGWPACISHVIGIGAVYDANIGPHGGCISSGSCTGYTCGLCSGKCYVDDPTSADLVTSYSNTASFMGLFAPSNNAYTLDIAGPAGYSSGDYYAFFGGTSAACPYAAGAGACLQSAANAIKGAYLSPAQVKYYLQNYGDSITDPKVGITKPRVNLGNAVNALSSGPDNNFLYNTVTPCRIVDTRIGLQGSGPIEGDDQRDFFAAGLCGVPYPSAKAVKVNIAVVNMTGSGYITAWAYGSSKPLISVLNYGLISGMPAIGNSVIVPICDEDVQACDFDLSIYSSKTTDIVIDIMGYFAAAP